jgi:uncharacterized protein (TIGR03435 family)
MTDFIGPRSRILVRLLLSSSLLPLCPAALIAQGSASVTPAVKPVTYDVVSIKQNKTDSGSTSISTDDNRLTATNVSLKQLLEFAYNIREDMISGLSGPVESARFDVEAKVLGPDSGPPPKLKDKQLEAMLIPLLAERFQIKSHTEAKTLPVYDLMIAKGGSKLKQAKGSSDDCSIGMSAKDNNRDLNVKNCPVSQFGDTLADQLHRTVIDQTGLSGIYDMELTWAPADVSDANPDSALSIFTAIQEQLGLKLQSGRGQVDTLVIDHAEMPSEN